MSHDALARTNKGKKTEPNSWFVGIAPRRNPDIVVAVLWENGNWGKNAATLAAQVIETFVEKQRKREGNLLVAKAPASAPAGVGSDVPFNPAAASASDEGDKRDAPEPPTRMATPVGCREAGSGSAASRECRLPRASRPAGQNRDRCFGPIFVISTGFCSGLCC